MVSCQMEMLLSHPKLNSEYRYCDLTLQVRDYIHIMDLASGYIKALDKLFTSSDIGKYGLSLVLTGSMSNVL